MTPDSALVASFLSDVRHGGAAERLVAVRQAALVGTAVLPALGAIYAGDDPAAGRAAWEAMQRIVSNAARPGAPDEARAAADALRQIAGPGQPRAVRADALQLLGMVGGAADTSVLAGLLEETVVRDDARMALERIPGPAADDALRRAARTCPPEYRPAIDQSLRHRHAKRAEVGARR